jgi:hypothetical protein
VIITLSRPFSDEGDSQKGVERIQAISAACWSLAAYIVQCPIEAQTLFDAALARMPALLDAVVEVAQANLTVPVLARGIANFNLEDLNFEMIAPFLFHLRCRSLGFAPTPVQPLFERADRPRIHRRALPDL